MEGCTAVERELEKLTERYDSFNTKGRQHLDESVDALQSLNEDLLDSPENNTIPQDVLDSIAGTIAQTKAAVNKVSSLHKDLHGSVSKLGKAIDRNFTSDFSSVLTEGAFDGLSQQLLLNEVICEHFLRQGMLDIAETLNEDANLQLSYDKKEPFLELHKILQALRHRDLTPAIEWAIRNREHLSKRKSPLEFKLHRLRFIELIKMGPSRQKDALEYARNLAPFANMHPKDMQQLMGSLLYMHKGIENSSYSYLFDDTSWEEICEIFMKDACGLLGLSVESPLSVGINAGCKALPPLLSIRQVMQSKQVAGVWSSKEELPVEIDLGQDYQFHSIFACPILKQQSTEQNPPMKLTCGHVISKDALHKLVVGSSNRLRQPGSANLFKCPYCPQEMITTETRQIYF